MDSASRKKCDGASTCVPLWAKKDAWVTLIPSTWIELTCRMAAPGYRRLWNMPLAMGWLRSTSAPAPAWCHGFARLRSGRSWCAHQLLPDPVLPHY